MLIGQAVSDSLRTHREKDGLADQPSYRQLACRRAIAIKKIELFSALIRRNSREIICKFLSLSQRNY